MAAPTNGAGADAQAAEVPDAAARAGSGPFPEAVPWLAGGATRAGAPATRGYPPGATHQVSSGISASMPWVSRRARRCRRSATPAWSSSGARFRGVAQLDRYAGVARRRERAWLLLQAGVADRLHL